MPLISNLLFPLPILAAGNSAITPGQTGLQVRRPSTPASWRGAVRLEAVLRRGIDGLCFEIVDNATIVSLSMIVSRIGCLQALCNQCEFVGNDRELSVHHVCNESEQKEAMFASKGDYVCKLLQIAVKPTRSRQHCGKLRR